MRNLIILAILLCFPVMLLAKPPEDRIKEKDVVGVKTEVYYQKAKEAGVITEISGIVKIKPADWKDVKIKDRIDLRILDEVGTDTQQAAKITDKTEDDTTLREKAAVIVDEEVSADVQTFAAFIAPVDVGYQAREMNKIFLSVQESEKLKTALRLIPSTQYPIVKLPFIETTNDDSGLYIVDVSKWTDIRKMQEDLKVGNYKLVMLMSERLNNSSTIELGGTVKDYPLNGKEFEIAYQAVKEVNPNIPVGFICVMFPQLENWLASFTVQPDVWLLFNVPVFGANWQKVKARWFSDRPVIANLNHHSQYHDYGGQQYGSAEYNDTITNLKSLGFSGAIWWR